MSLLNDADDVLLGAQGVAAVYRGNQLVWPKPITATDLVSDQVGNLVSRGQDGKAWVGIKNVNPTFDFTATGVSGYFINGALQISSYGNYESTLINSTGVRSFFCSIKTRGAKLTMNLSVQLQLVSGLTGAWVTKTSTPTTINDSAPVEFRIDFKTHGQSPGTGKAKLTITISDEDTTYTEVIDLDYTVLPPLGTNAFGMGVSPGSALEVVQQESAITARWEGQELCVDIPADIPTNLTYGNAGYVMLPATGIQHPYPGPDPTSGKYPFDCLYIVWLMSRDPVMSGSWQSLNLDVYWDTDGQPQSTEPWFKGEGPNAHVSNRWRMMWMFETMNWYGTPPKKESPGRWRLQFSFSNLYAGAMSAFKYRINIPQWNWEYGAEIPYTTQIPLSVSSAQEITAAPETPESLEPQVQEIATPRKPYDTAYLISSDADNCLTASEFDGKLYLGSGLVQVFSWQLAPRREDAVFTPAEVISTDPDNLLILGNDQKLKVKGVPTGSIWGMDYYGQPPLQIVKISPDASVSAAWSGSDIVINFNCRLGNENATPEIEIYWAPGPKGLAPHPSWDRPRDMQYIEATSWSITPTWVGTSENIYVTWGWSPSGQGFGNHSVHQNKGSADTSWVSTEPYLQSSSYLTGETPSLGRFFVRARINAAGQGNIIVRTSQCRFRYIPYPS